MLLHLLNLVERRTLLKDFVRTLHEWAGEQSLPVLQISKHIIHVDDAIAEHNIGLIAIADLLDVSIIYLHVVEVHASSHLLDFMDYLASCRPYEIGVVMLVHD